MEIFNKSIQSIFSKKDKISGKETNVPVIYPPEFPIAIPEPGIQKEIKQPVPLSPEIIPNVEPKTYPGKE